VGFQCIDGFVLCADRLISHGKAGELGSFSHYDKKLFGLDCMSAAGAVCGAGDSILIKAAAESFLDEFSAQVSIKDTLPDVIQILDNALNRVAAKIGGPPDMSLLAVTVAEGETPSFIRSDGLVIQKANPVEILGIGETSLARYLIDLAYKSTLDLNQLAALGILVVYGAKKYCPQYCGGKTDVYIAPKNYFWDGLPVNEERVDEIETMLARSTQEDLVRLIADAGEKFQRKQG
jgi:hypothetical protein